MVRNISSVGIRFDQSVSKQGADEREYLFRRAQEVAGIGSFTLDIVSPEKSIWSEQVYRIIGLPARTPTLSHLDILRKIIHKADKRKVYGAFVSALENASSFNEVFRVVHPNGTLRHIQCNAEPVCNENDEVVKFIGTALDITERIRIEEELVTSHRQTTAILDTTVDGIITINEDGCIHSFNKAAERIFGYHAEEVIGENVSILMPEPYRDEHDDYIKRYLESQKARIIGIGREVLGLRKDKTTFPMELAVSETTGSRRIFTGIVRDITDRRQMQREILHVGEFERQRIGQELHDGLGSQLTGIGMICQSVARQMEKTGSEYASVVKEIAEQIKEADYHARNIARGLVPVAAEPDGLVTALNRLTAYAKSTGIECSVQTQGSIWIEEPTVSTHLYRIVQEAVVNAIMHSKAENITIKLKVEEESGDISLEVMDDGVGLSEEDFEGQGIGLRTMDYRAKMLGATLSIKTEKHKGTAIMFEISGREIKAFHNHS